VARASFKTTWLRAVIDSESGLSKSAVTVALVLSIYANRGGICFPSVRTIASNARSSRSTVFAALNELEVLGFLLRDPGRSGRSNRYVLVLPGQ
jgi:hypothetical protein